MKCSFVCAPNEKNTWVEYCYCILNCISNIIMKKESLWIILASDKQMSDNVPFATEKVWALSRKGQYSQKTGMVGNAIFVLIWFFSS